MNDAIEAMDELDRLSMKLVENPYDAESCEQMIALAVRLGRLSDVSPGRIIKEAVDLARAKYTYQQLTRAWSA